MTSSQGSPASPEKMFIAMLALLPCQVSASPIQLSIGHISQILNTLDWILPPLEQLMTFFTPSLTLFLEKTFCLISLVMLLLVL